MSPAVSFFAALGAGVAGAAALLRPSEVRPGVWRLEGLVAAVCVAIALLVGWALGSFGGGGGGWWWLAPAFGLTAVAVVARGPLAPAALAAAALLGAWWLQGDGATVRDPTWLREAAALSAAAVLGTAMAAMLLGHWYLVDHGMSLRPLKRLAIAYGVAVGARCATLGLGLWAQPDVAKTFSGAEAFLAGGGAMLLLVGAFGVLLPPLLAFATWRTLQVPNTQSATGILYVACIAAFIADIAARGAAL